MAVRVRGCDDAFINLARTADRCKETDGMKMTLAHAALFTFLTIIATVIPLTANATTADQAAEEAVRTLNAREVQAFLQKDPNTLGQLWSDDFVVTNPLNTFLNKQQVLRMVESGFLVIASYDRQVEYVRVYGDMVIVAGNETVLWGGAMPNAGRTEHLRFTGIWMKQRGRWQQIARHANVVPQ
jgi:ketosteroid isomerase-like protein